MAQARKRGSAKGSIHEDDGELWALLNGTQAVAARDIQPGSSQMLSLRKAADQNQLTCLLCAKPLQLAGSEQGIHFIHGQHPSHEAETPMRRAARKMIAARMKELFPSALIETNVAISSQVTLDVLLITGVGGKMGVVLRELACSVERYQLIEEEAERQGVVLLWLGTLAGLSSKAPRTSKRRLQTPGETIHKVALDELATRLVARDLPLWYVDPRSHSLMQVMIHPQAQRLAREGQIKKLGQVPAVLRNYPLSQLRIKTGLMAVLTDYDPPLPDMGALPARLNKLL